MRAFFAAEDGRVLRNTCLRTFGGGSKPGRRKGEGGLTARDKKESEGEARFWKAARWVEMRRQHSVSSLVTVLRRVKNLPALFSLHFSLRVGSLLTLSGSSAAKYLYEGTIMMRLMSTEAFQAGGFLGSSVFQEIKVQRSIWIVRMLRNTSNTYIMVVYK